MLQPNRPGFYQRLKYHQPCLRYQPLILHSIPFVDIIPIHQDDPSYFRFNLQYLPALLIALTKELLANGWTYPTSAATLLETEEKVYFREISLLGSTRFVPRAARSKFFVKPQVSVSYNSTGPFITLTKRKDGSRFLDIQFDHVPYLYRDLVDCYLTHFGCDDLLYTSILESISLLKKSGTVQDLFSVARKGLKADIEMYRKLTDAIKPKKKKTSWFRPCNCLPPADGSTGVIDSHGACYFRLFSEDEIESGTM